MLQDLGKQKSNNNFLISHIHILIDRLLTNVPNCLVIDTLVVNKSRV